MRHERMNAAWILNLCPPFEKKTNKEWQTINLLLLAWLQSFQNQVLLKCNNCISLSYKHANNLHACSHTHGPVQTSGLPMVRAANGLTAAPWDGADSYRVVSTRFWSLCTQYFVVSPMCVYARTHMHAQYARHGDIVWPSTSTQRVVNISTISFAGGVKLPFQ